MFSMGQGLFSAGFRLKFFKPDSAHLSDCLHINTIHSMATRQVVVKELHIPPGYVVPAHRNALKEKIYIFRSGSVVIFIEHGGLRRYFLCSHNPMVVVPAGCWHGISNKSDKRPASLKVVSSCSNNSTEWEPDADRLIALGTHIA